MSDTTLIATSGQMNNYRAAYSPEELQKWRKMRYLGFKMLHEWVYCPLCRSDNRQLCMVAVMGDYRYNRKRCCNCQLYFGGKEWMKRTSE